jgi:hypothetical protein
MYELAAHSDPSFWHALCHIRSYMEQRQKMPAEDQTRSQCNDHCGDVVPLARVIEPVTKNNRYCEHEEACT